MSKTVSDSLKRLCTRGILNMSSSLVEWDMYFTDKIRDGEEIPIRCLAKAACVWFVYFNLLTVFFVLYFKLSWAEFIDFRYGRNKVYNLMRFSSALAHGYSDHGSIEVWDKCRSLASRPSISPDKDMPPEKKGSRFALYVSILGEEILQAMIKNAANSGELIEALEKPETFTAQGTVLRIWYGSYWESPIIPVLQEFWDRASEDDYKGITAFPEGDVTEVGYFYGPLRLRTSTDFDYDLSHADGTSWLCRSCSELDNDFSDHGFQREWEAVEELGKNGHSLGSHLTKHVNGEIFCKACGCYNVIDEKTGLEVNNPN
ncbi:MAG: hypothetical protein DELT_02612 [Desulfovibrio sp.]